MQPFKFIDFFVVYHKLSGIKFCWGANAFYLLKFMWKLMAVYKKLYILSKKFEIENSDEQVTNQVTEPKSGR